MVFIYLYLNISQSWLFDWNYYNASNCVTAFKIYTHHSYFKSLPVINTTEIHQHETSLKKLFKVRTEKVLTERCVRHQLVKVINEIPDIVKSKVHTHSYSGFKTYIKHFFLQKYETECNIRNCYVCNAWVVRLPHQILRITIACNTYYKPVANVLPFISHYNGYQHKRRTSECHNMWNIYHNV